MPSKATKRIVVRVKPSDFVKTGYYWEFRVVSSSHPNYRVGSRFDFGFAALALEAGYEVRLLPE
jgi:hypothetical protein